MTNKRANVLISLAVAGVMATGLAGWRIAAGTATEHDHSAHQPKTVQAESNGTMGCCPAPDAMAEKHDQMHETYSDKSHADMPHSGTAMHNEEGAGCGGPMSSMMDQCGMTKMQ